jgi:argininosuccinate synthase
MIMKKNTDILLAFSGGLDTSFCAAWLMKEKGYTVHAVTIDTGGFSSNDLEAIRERAELLGVASWICIDGIAAYYKKVIRYLVYGNVLKNGSYPLSVSAERMTQAFLLADHARKLGFTKVAHGSTGAGNDQVRFDLVLDLLVPSVEVLTPIRDLRLSREAEIEWLTTNGYAFDFTKAAYSINKGLWGTSVGGKETLTSHLPLPEEAWPTSCTATEPQSLSIGFEQGEIKSVNGQPMHPVTAIQCVQQLAAPYGIGRDIHTGDTIIGIKGRVGFEAAAPLLIIRAHHTLEKHVLTKWQLLLKEQQANWYGTWLHEGLYFEPAMRDIETFMTSTQKLVTGEVFLTLHPYRFSIDGIQSPNDLMQAQGSSYGEMNKDWTGDDVKGFTKIYANAVKTWMKLHQQHEEIIA